MTLLCKVHLALYSIWMLTIQSNPLNGSPIIIQSVLLVCAERYGEFLRQWFNFWRTKQWNHFKQMMQQICYSPTAWTSGDRPPDPCEFFEAFWGGCLAEWQRSSAHQWIAEIVGGIWRPSYRTRLKFGSFSGLSTLVLLDCFSFSLRSFSALVLMDLSCWISRAVSMFTLAWLDFISLFSLKWFISHY